MNGDEEQQPQQQPQRPQSPQQTPPQFNFHSVTQPQDSSTLVSSARYQYKSKKLPDKPKILDAVKGAAEGGVEQYQDAS